MNLREKSITKMEVETLFMDVLSLEQIEEIKKILSILAIYMFVDREQLNWFAEKMYGEKIALTFIKKAIKHNLIAERQDENFRFYFKLKTGGFTVLQSDNIPYRKFPLTAGTLEHEKIFAINNYLISKNYLLRIVEGTGLFEPLVTINGKLLVNSLTEADASVAKLMKQHSLQLEKMVLSEAHISKKLKGNRESMLE